MILTCPNCASRFLLSAQVLAPEGRRVKCSSCAEEWFQLPDPDELIDNIEHEIEEIPESVKPVPEGSSVPALPDEDVQEEGNARANLAGYAGALLVFLFLLGGLVASKDTMLKIWPPSAALYEMFGMSMKAPGEGLVFDKVKASLTSPDTIVVEGLIINLTGDVLSLPSVEDSVRNEAGESIQHNLSHPPFNEMKPETTLPFKSTYKGDTGEADHVQIRFVYKKGNAPDGVEERHEEAKNVSINDDNTQALHADDHVEPHDDEAH